MILPFNLTRAEAKDAIEEFVGKRKFFAHPKFKKEFTTENIMGVYFPYVVVDINAHAHLTGQGERTTKTYTVGQGNQKETYHDVDVYDVEREFDLTIEGLTVESSADKLNKNSDNTNNIINAILPFDTENCVNYNANYLKGYTAEKRDLNIDELKPDVDTQSKDIARFSILNTLKKYKDRGVRWDKEDLEVRGRRWNTAYLPVWLYSYRQVKAENKSLLHYVAINARTKEIHGSVPLHMPKLIMVSLIMEIISRFIIEMVDWTFEDGLMLSGIIFFVYIYLKYRNILKSKTTTSMRLKRKL